MQDARFDPGGFYEFNLAGGTVRTRGGDRVLMLSDKVVSSLISAAARDGDLTPLRRLGESLGDEVLRSMDRPASVMSPEAMLGFATGVIALFGWGRLDFERWGKALVIVASGLPEVDGDELGAAALLGGMFSRVSQKQVACVPVGESRFMMVGLNVAETVWGWYKSGIKLPEIVGRLADGDSA